MNIVLFLRGFVTTTALILFGLTAPLAANAQEASPPTPANNPAVAQDYLVVVGKHTMWHSQIGKMHPSLAKTAKPVSKNAGSDYMVQVGKKSVLASTLRRVESSNTTRPYTHNMACKDYQVQSGKTVVWASEIGAPCPAGPHKGEKKPLCCVVSINDDQKKLLPCCRNAQGK